MEIPQKSITLKSTMVAQAEAATRQIEAAIEALSHDGFDIAITLTWGHCAGAFAKLGRRRVL